MTDASGSLQIQKISQGGLDVKLLDTKDAFIVDAVSGGIFVWVGKECTINERKHAMEYGQEYLAKQVLVFKPFFNSNFFLFLQVKRTGPAEVVRVLEGAEPARFTQWFSNWSKERKTSDFVPKLYQCSNESGKLHVEEIANFYQEVCFFFFVCSLNS